ncbi:MAG: hypothetical protein K2I49_02925 [Ureaplasma sp.]|nr:hypothetical protein [Ureaplasma sp.]
MNRQNNFVDNQNYNGWENNQHPNQFNQGPYQQQVNFNNQDYYNPEMMQNQNPDYLMQQEPTIDVSKLNEKNFTLFKNEKNWVIIKVILFTLGLFALVGFCGAMIYYQINVSSRPSWYNSPYYFIPVGLGIIIFFVFWIIQLLDLKNWLYILRQLKQVGSYKLNATDFIRNFYKKSIKWYISLNWFCGYIYFLWLLGILFAFILSYVAQIYTFGGFGTESHNINFGSLNWSKAALTNTNPEISGNSVVYAFSVLPICTLIFGSSLVGFMIFVQLINILVFKLRKKALENNFNNIFSYDTYYAISRTTNKANFIAYSIITLIFVIALIIFIFVTKKLIRK